MPLARLAALSFVLATSACTFTDQTDFARYQEKGAIELTEGPAPADAKPLGVVYAERGGFYLFGLVPVAAVELDNTMPLLVEEARKLKADGIAQIQVVHAPASCIGFSSTTLITFPWTANLKLTGMAWQRPKR